MKVWFSIIASLCYCYFISSNIPKGKLRLLSLTPVLCLFTFLPLQLSYVLPTDIVVGLCNIVANAALGIELELPSNEPYLSTSLQEFWGRRWNLIVTNLLRHTIYIPVRTALSRTVLGPQWASVPGVMASFVVSGIMHELLFYYVTRAAPTWEVTCFFVLHGVCVVVELCVMKWLGHKGMLHWAISGPVTVVFVVATAACLFFPPLLRDGADERALEEFRNLVDCIKETF
ncbi:Long-chain-alcohol O-fatty-acyltransferase [Arachis hypogaea]|nr:Long-chain-alcohol O-fatty-acyltransferase [Arachis hypogaea]